MVWSAALPKIMIRRLTLALLGSFSQPNVGRWARCKIPLSSP